MVAYDYSCQKFVHDPNLAMSPIPCRHIIIMLALQASSGDGALTSYAVSTPDAVPKRYAVPRPHAVLTPYSGLPMLNRLL